MTLPAAIAGAECVVYHIIEQVRYGVEPSEVLLPEDIVVFRPGHEDRPVVLERRLEGRAASVIGQAVLGGAAELVSAMPDADEPPAGGSCRPVLTLIRGDDSPRHGPSR